MKRRNRCNAKLRLYPDPILKVVCEPVGDDEDVSGIIRDMMHILTNSKTGIGLAAPQAGHTKRVIVVSVKGFYTTMINPSISRTSSRCTIQNEGCLSYPGLSKNIKRLAEITLTWTSERGVNFIDKPYSDLSARIIQHEMDHLDGKCKVGN